MFCSMYSGHTVQFRRLLELGCSDCKLWLHSHLRRTSARSSVSWSNFLQQKQHVNSTCELEGYVNLRSALFQCFVQCIVDTLFSSGDC